MRSALRWGLLLAALALVAAAQQPFTIADVVAIKYPSAPAWSADGHTITFTWDEGGVYHRYTVDAGHPGTPALLPDAAPAAAAGRGATGGRGGRGNASPDGSLQLRQVGGQRVDHDRTFPEVGNKLIFRITEGIPGKLEVVPRDGGAAIPLQVPPGVNNARWVNDSTLVASAVSADNTTRTIYLLDARGGPFRAIHTDRDDKFWSINGRDANPQLSPDRKWLLFGSDTGGWDRFYVMPALGGDAVAITPSGSDSWRASWSHDGARLAFDANTEARPGTRHLGVVTLHGDPAHATLAWLTHGDGTNIAPVWSPDDTRLVYQHADAQQSGDLYVIPAAGGTPVRLTRSMPPALQGRRFVAPRLVHYAAADGASVPAWLFVPPNLDRSRKHPAIVWIHPDGVNQNYDGWHTDRNEAVYYAFHQYLLQQGYVVIAPDYRGSIGYSRAWREGVYRDVGGQDATDARRAAVYLKTLPYVDPARIGVWGLSYGGYFTLRAITQDPTLFACAIDVAGLVDPAMYYQDPYHSGWMAERMGTPGQNPEGYRKGETSTHMDQLQRPLLVLAGTADVNVPFWETTLMLDSALKAGKGDLLTFMMYPGEFHYFDRAHVLTDAWTRADHFFRANLRPH
ncbi:MAG TPA: prolyl oligopeptidase family serine peptidase [Terriglobales bacterium]|nr:prolyl oligopeptidase family serine peptidase [Terriglobales bacterium]